MTGTGERPILDVSHLTVSYRTPSGDFRAVDDVSFTVRAGERFGLVGESGSGKSTTALAIMGLLRPEARLEGSVRLNGREMVGLSPAAFRTLRFSEVSLVPQGAMSSLNPVLRIGEQMADILIDHGVQRRAAEWASNIADLLAQVGLPANVVRRYPHELSGGMKQRVCIAMAIALRPALILADEPTSALDVIVQRQVFATLDRAQRALGAAIVLIGHDMALMAQFVTTLGVMRAGKLLEAGPVRDVLARPSDPYTRALIEALPNFQRDSRLSQRLAAPTAG